MANIVASVTLYLITIALLPEKGRDVAISIVNIARVLSDTHDVRFVHRFKVVGEPTIVAIVEVAKAVSLERILGRLHRVGTLDIECQPVIAYEDFARNLGVAEELIRPLGRILKRDNLFLIKFTDEYYDNTSDEYIAARKRSAESVIPYIPNESIRIQRYKYLAERIQINFMNINDKALFDRRSFDFVGSQAFGSNFHIDSNGLQFLEDYTASVTNYNGY